MHVTAIIPAKGTSRRLPGKNLLPFPDPGGELSLLAHKIGQLLRCERIDAVVVGSDDPAVLHEARAYGALTRQRDAYHCDEARCPLRERWRNLVAMVETDLVVWAHCTNPLCTPDVYDLAVDRFVEAWEDGHGYCDSLCSVDRLQRHAWFRGEPLNYNPWSNRHPFAGELDPVLTQNGAIFIQPHHQMLENGYFFGTRPLFFEVPFPAGLDIDTHKDLELARWLYAALRQNRGAPC